MIDTSDMDTGEYFPLVVSSDTVSEFNSVTMREVLNEEALENLKKEQKSLLKSISLNSQTYRAIGDLNVLRCVARYVELSLLDDRLNDPDNHLKVNTGLSQRNYDVRRENNVSATTPLESVIKMICHARYYFEQSALPPANFVDVAQLVISDATVFKKEQNFKAGVKAVIDSFDRSLSYY